ncbi:hypothetical protein WA1_15300 [Scytonema hofmannii PCC 7110]|uniref:vWA-MoxR associated protein C-terminal domain-containing protein n=1 Tax=Scytonema hofmannii PCC 7110 TaxID=128403 RepID=A0A139XDE5_9CYAN|nr:hypothetical protein [Scytonema hofmannii]KYC42705.1 hypothetical protein WA1_15300 [Scytonema hofmannii PCC 7110]
MTHAIPCSSSSTVEGNQNRTVQGNNNQAVQGNSNTVISDNLVSNTNNIVFNIIMSDNKNLNQELEFKKEVIKTIQQVDEFIVRQAVRDSLPDWPVLSTDNINEFIEQKFGNKEILTLVTNLLRVNQSFSHEVYEKLHLISNSIQENVKHLTVPSIEDKSGTRIVVQESNNFQSYLLIVLRPEIDGSNTFRIKAWLILDDKMLDKNDPSKGFLPLDIKNEEVICLISEISENVEKFLEESLKILNSHTRRYQRNFNLTIEFFLPYKNLCEEIYQWLFMDDPVEILHGVLLRSSERLDRRYLIKYDNQWRKNWQKVQDCFHSLLSQDDFYELKSIENCDWKKITSDLKQKIGLKVACALSVSKSQDLFQAIHKAAAPIAIWSMCDIPHQKLEIEINDFLNKVKLIELPELLRKKREEVYAYSDKYSGYLSILWEDPYRLPPVPDVIELLTPGQ